jgi:hypothetical protein
VAPLSPVSNALAHRFSFVRIYTVALDFLPTDANFEKFGITNIQLPAPLSASDGWAVGIWFRFRAALSDTTDRNGVNQLLQLATVANGAWNTPSTINIWWAVNNNGAFIDGVESVNGKFYAVPSGWVAGDNGNPGNWSDVAFTNDDINRLLILQLVNVAGSWKLRLYVTAKGSSATLVNESPVVTPSAIAIDHIRIGNRIPAQANRDWRDVAGQLFLLKRPLSTTEITQLATGSAAISAVASASDILGHWPLEAAGAVQNDATGRGNNLSQLGTAATYAGFDFLSIGMPAIAAATALHNHLAQSPALLQANILAASSARHTHAPQAISLAGNTAIAPASTTHLHAAQANILGLIATTIARPFPFGDVDLTLSSVSAASSAAPVVTLFGDAEANQNIPNSWHNLCARLFGLLGKTPQISIANVHQWRNGGAIDLGLPQRGWRPWWRVAGGASTSWQRFDSYTMSGNSISFANTAAFGAASIDVAFFPVWNLDETNELFDAIYASSSGTEPPAAISYRSTRSTLPPGTHNETAAVTSPDGIAVPILPMRSARISTPATLSPEGLPKRKAVIFFNIHAQEASGGWTADRFLRTLISSNANAIWLRERFMFDCYSVNNSGLAGGASRGVVEGWNGISELADPNRAWPAQISPPNGPLPEVNDVAAAILTNSNGKADVLLSFHSDAETSVDYGLAYYYAGWDSLGAVKGFKDSLLASPAVATLIAGSDHMTEVYPGLYKDQGFGRNVLGAALSWVQETTFATSDYLADSQSIATRHIDTLRQLTETGFLPVAVQVTATLHGHQAQAAAFAITGTVPVQPAAHVHKATVPILLATGQLAPASAGHAQSANPSLFAVARQMAPLYASHTHTSASIALTAGGQLTPSSARHAHASIPASLLTTAQLTPVGARHAQTVNIIPLIAAGQLALQSARHSHSGKTAFLSVPGTGPTRGRIRPVTTERRILKLRFS